MPEKKQKSELEIPKGKIIIDFDKKSLTPSKDNPLKTAAFQSFQKQLL